MNKITIKVYSFNELSETAKNKAIIEHTEFMESTPVECENEAGEMIDEYFEYSENEVIEDIEANGYIYFADGTLANCVTYTGTHPKTGITELTLHGEVYNITQ